MSDVQVTLREPYDDALGTSAVISRSSVDNKRIERWWGYLITAFAQQYMDMVTSAVLDMNNVLHRECVRFVFLSVIQKELDDWNLH